MKKFLLIFSFALFTIFFFIKCGQPEELISPTHYSRVPRAVNLTASYDTTETGKYRIMLSWGVTGTENLKDFEIYRSVNNANFFFLTGGIVSTNFIDSSLANTSDYTIAYFINGRGIDRFVGQSSDTLRLIVTKSF